MRICAAATIVWYWRWQKSIELVVYDEYTKPTLVRLTNIIMKQCVSFITEFDSEAHHPHT